MRGRLLSGLAAAAMLLPAAAPAQTGADVVVTGRRLEQLKRVKRAVIALTDPVESGGFENQYARWEVPVCVAVVGMPADGARFIADRIGAVARSVGARAAEPGCKPNVFIVASDDPDAFLRQALDHRPIWFRGLGAAEIGVLQRDTRAVRWISGTGISSAQGDPVQPDGMEGHAFGVVKQWQASNIEAATQTRLTHMLVLVDGRSTTGVSYGALADYLTMVTLARLQPKAVAPTVDTILSLLPARKADAPQALTAFDRAYLDALYHMDPQLHGDMQRAQMVRRIDMLMQDEATAPAP